MFQQQLAAFNVTTICSRMQGCRFHAVCIINPSAAFQQQFAAFHMTTPSRVAQRRAEKVTMDMDIRPVFQQEPAAFHMPFPGGYVEGRTIVFTPEMDICACIHQQADQVEIAGLARIRQWSCAVLIPPAVDILDVVFFREFPDGGTLILVRRHWG